jgi:hypothetical protein
MDCTAIDLRVSVLQKPRFGRKDHLGFLSSSLHPSRQTYSTASECAIQEWAKQFPSLTVEPLHLHLLDGGVVTLAGIHRDSW